MFFTSAYIPLEATFLREFSLFDKLSSAQNKRSLSKIQSAVVYLRDYYIKQLVAAGHHVLYTIPVWNIPSQAPYYGLTSVVFHVYSKKTTAKCSCDEQSFASEPVIVIPGMCGGRPMPASVLQYSAEWVPLTGGSPSYGTAAISGSLFLTQRLLPILSDCNARTTIIPTFSGVERDIWKLELTSLANHPKRQPEDCAFTLVSGSGADGSLRFCWQNHEKYSTEHEEGGYAMSGIYSVGCKCHPNAVLRSS